jgi:hypothetical protein
MREFKIADFRLQICALYLVLCALTVLYEYKIKEQSTKYKAQICNLKS